MPKRKSEIKKHLNIRMNAEAKRQIIAQAEYKGMQNRENELKEGMRLQQKEINKFRKLAGKYLEEKCNIKRDLDQITELLKAVLRNQLKLAKSIQFKEDINIEYFEEKNEQKK